ncbi:MAG TPA: glucuronoxylanase XynC [Prolixibacteraceae bacterium]|nr:glucuronoxylanase XynC [Prolixibacteraceae bacterium]
MSYSGKITMMLKKIVLLSIFAFLIFNLNAQEAIIDVSKVKQVIDGFGASTAWHGQLTTPEADAAFKNDKSNQMGLSILRVRIDPSSSWWNDEKQNAIRAKNRGAMILASPWSPPASMKTNNNTTGGELKPSSYADYAIHLKNFCSHLGNVDVVSLQNEPNIEVGYESCNWTPAQLLTFCKNNASAIGKPVMAPEAFNFDKNYSDPILNDSTANAHVQYIGGHLYGASAYNYTNAISKGKKVWMTEKYFNPDDIETCITMAKEITDCMYNNMNAYVWWYLRQPGCNLIEAGGKLKKKGFTMGQYSKFVRPGFNRVDATYQPKTKVYLVAFKGKDQNVVVVINQNKNTVSQIFSFKNDTVFSVKKYVTSGSKNLNDEGTLKCTSNSFTDNLDAQSITTYVTSKIPTGNHTLKEPEIRIFPNPASDIIQLSSIENVTGWQVYDVLGKKFFTQKHPTSSVVGISSLNSGIYIIRIQQKEKEYSFKFVKN